MIVINQGNAVPLLQSYGTSKSADMDLLIQLSRRNQLDVESAVEGTQPKLLPESEFLKLLRTEFQKTARK